MEKKFEYGKIESSDPWRKKLEQLDKMEKVYKAHQAAKAAAQEADAVPAVPPSKVHGPASSAKQSDDLYGSSRRDFRREATQMERRRQIEETNRRIWYEEHCEELEYELEGAEEASQLERMRTKRMSHGLKGEHGAEENEHKRSKLRRQELKREHDSEEKEREALQLERTRTKLRKPEFKREHDDEEKEEASQLECMRPKRVVQELKRGHDFKEEEMEASKLERMRTKRMIQELKREHDAKEIEIEASQLERMKTKLRIEMLQRELEKEKAKELLLEQKYREAKSGYKWERAEKTTKDLEPSLKTAEPTVTEKVKREVERREKHERHEAKEKKREEELDQRADAFEVKRREERATQQRKDKIREAEELQRKYKEQKERAERKRKEIQDAAELRRREAEALETKNALERRGLIRNWLIERAVKDHAGSLTKKQLKEQLKDEPLEREIEELLRRKLQHREALERKRVERRRLERAGHYEPRQDATQNERDQERVLREKGRVSEREGVSRYHERVSGGHGADRYHDRAPGDHERVVGHERVSGDHERPSDHERAAGDHKVDRHHGYEHKRVSKEHDRDLSDHEKSVSIDYDGNSKDHGTISTGSDGNLKYLESVAIDYDGGSVDHKGDSSDRERDPLDERDQDSAERDHESVERDPASSERDDDDAPETKRAGGDPRRFVRQFQCPEDDQSEADRIMEVIAQSDDPVAVCSVYFRDSHHDPQDTSLTSSQYGLKRTHFFETAQKLYTLQAKMDALVEGIAERRQGLAATKEHLNRQELQAQATDQSPSENRKKGESQRRRRRLGGERGVRCSSSNDVSRPSDVEADDEEVDSVEELLPVGRVVTSSDEWMARPKFSLLGRFCSRRNTYVVQPLSKIPRPVRKIPGAIPQEEPRHGHQRLCGGDDSQPIGDQNWIKYNEVVEVEESKPESPSYDQLSHKDLGDNLKRQMSSCARRLMAILRTSDEGEYYSDGQVSGGVTEGVFGELASPLLSSNQDLGKKLLAIAVKLNQHVDHFVTNCAICSRKWRSYEDLKTRVMELLASEEELDGSESLVQKWWFCCRALYLLRDIFSEFGDKRVLLVRETLKTIDWFYKEWCTQKTVSENL
ncbi:trichohyalin-like [Drosophila ananassae]|uniref:trichohyalin-like n=1 Tax=Drosophila ananassae TaxID=7217 RepID=UPI0013A5C962|nr:trichohyalin-like [Drosophila ananassae]